MSSVVASGKDSDPNSPQGMRGSSEVSVNGPIEGPGVTSGMPGSQFKKSW